MNNLYLLSAFLMAVNVTISAQSNIDSSIQNEPLRPIPEVVITEPGKVALGNRLFHDTRLSANNTVSCASCHPLTQAGVDNLPVAIGINGLKGTRNTPSVYNSALHFRQFWDGRVKTLEEQSEQPLFNPAEMGANWPAILATLSNDSWYQAQFSTLYKGSITVKNIANAIATFERTLLTPNSPFDQYLKGDMKAISPETIEGYQLFKSYGCASCHQGVAVGGNMFEKLGVVIPYFPNTHSDSGRFLHTGIEEHRHELKVPSLRNIELTAPYLHNGTIGSLYEIVEIMGKYQLGRDIPKNDIEKIILFLQSLTALPKPVKPNE